MAENRLLGIFAKYWEPGKVKTRLAATIGDEKAAAVYRVFVQTLLWRFEHTGDSREVAFTPDDREQGFQRILDKGDSEPNWSLHSQGSGDLGERMQRFFERSFSDGFSKVVLIGTDSPTVPTENLERAFELLDEHPVVLGPTEDGGYYLVAARDCPPPVFADIHWSTGHVWSQTIERLQEQEIDYAVLPKWYDVDEIGDLERLRADVESMHREDGIDAYRVADRLRTELNEVLEQQK